MSFFTSLASVLATPTPAWLMAFIIGGLYLAHHLMLGRRLQSYARSFNHMDRWADSVEMRLEDMGYDDHRTPVAVRPAPPRLDRRMMTPANDRRRNHTHYRELSDSEVTALISRIIRDRAA
jgi:hypothetical protein